MADINLKPCPFCGSDASLMEDYDQEDVGAGKPISEWRITGWDISCRDYNDCIGGAVGCTYTTQEYAIKAWNKRV